MPVAIYRMRFTTIEKVMHFKGINIPNTVIKAVREGALVIFAGAGVSVNAPTNLPSFRDLVKEIARYAGKTYDESIREDEYLGALESDSINIHSIIAEMLGKPELEPNAFHKNILNIFKSTENIRIVTTNQDLMFEKAAKSLGFDANKYYAPALPFGNKFTGIVHLHGSVLEPENMVMTDSDFGKAYMLNGYATRFLVDMFNNYVVVFIGYSYDDPVVRYLTASIPSDNMPNAYILTDDKDSIKISRTGLKIIDFPQKNFQQECEAINELGLYNKRGLLDWETRIAGLDLSAPPLDINKEDELLDGINTSGIQKILSSRMVGREWVYWLDERQQFDALFVVEATLNDINIVWAKWLTEKCFFEEIVQLFIKHKHTINSKFSEIILLSFSSNDADHADNTFIRLFELFKPFIKLTHYTAVKLSQIATERGISTIQLDILKMTCNYTIVVKENPFYEYLRDTERNVSRFDYDYKLHIGFNALEHIWTDIIKNHFDKPYEHLLFTTELIKSINTDMTLVSEHGRAPFSFNYISIEKNEEDLFVRDDIAAVCAMMIQSYKAIEEIDSTQAIGWIKQNVYRENVPLIRRVALKMLRETAILSADEKLQLLLENFDLNELYEKEQIFLLVENCFNDANENIQHTIIERVSKIPEEKEQITERERKNKYYESFNWLSWIKGFSDNKTIIDNRISIIKKEYPYFEARVHPELDIFFSPGVYVNEGIVPDSELKEMTYEQRERLLDEYNVDEYSVGTDRHTLMNQISRLCSQDFEWAISWAEHMAHKKDWTEDIWEAFLMGVENSTLELNQFERVFSLICIIPNNYLNKQRAEYLLKISERKGLLEKVKEYHYKEITTFIISLWENSELEEIEGAWFIKTINSAKGKLSLALLNLASSKNTDGIDECIKSFISNKRYNALNTEVFVYTLGLNTGRLYYLDPIWTKETVFPLLDTEPNVRIAAWEGLLIGNRNFSPQIAEELLPIFHENINKRNAFDDDMNNAFIEDYILFFINIIENPLLEYVVPIIKQGEGLILTKTITRMFETKDSFWTEDIWRKWLCRYWENRNNNMPIKLSSEEYSEMLLWVFYIKDIRSVVELILNLR